MPCYDGRDSMNGGGVSHAELSRCQTDLSNSKSEVSWLEAALCALLSALDRREITSTIVAEASRDGLIGLMEFWATHNAGDEARLARDLHRYSKDEQAVLLQLLTKDKD